MLWFVGLGVSGCDSVPAGALEVIGRADMTYLEQFTSPISDADVKRLRGIAGGTFRTARRWLVEDGNEILAHAVSKEVVMIAYGDPYIATTHAELRARAASRGIATRSIHASSAVTAIIGECGLHMYKVGRTATIMSDVKSMTTPYRTIYRNMIEGSHTMLLLEYDQEAGFFLDPADALNGLLNTEKGQGRNVMSGSTYAIVASRVGREDQSIRAGLVSSLVRASFGNPPHTIIIPGALHFTESDALEAFAECLDAPHDNHERIVRIPHQMIKKYVPMVMDAIRTEAAHDTGAAGFGEILENAELYARDAERFLDEGQEEVAVLSIGYADGLVDALRIARGAEPNT